MSIVSGGMAGTAVDVALFPLDTIKTRMQSSLGLMKSGGFRGVYSGLIAAAGGSAPGAALFFGSYELAKGQLHKGIPQDSHYAPVVHMVAGATGEVTACLVRVPTENVKQKMQAQLFTSTSQTMRNIINTQGFKGFYVGYNITLMREIPFAIIQFPLYEKIKKLWSKFQHHPVSPWQAAICGSIAGGIAAAVTTPMDVIKTRLMLGHDAKGILYKSPIDVLRRVFAEERGITLFSGVGPRVMWISIGGSVFFGAYEAFKKLLVNFSQ